MKRLIISSPAEYLLGLIVSAILCASSSGQEMPAEFPRALRDKTLVAWVAPANLIQRHGSVLTVDQLGTFDSIILGEQIPGKWMAGSEGWHRTPPDQSENPRETAASGEFVEMAIVYRGNHVAIFRNAKQIAGYEIERPAWFPLGTAIVMGKHHVWAGDEPCFAGSIEDARVYDCALSPLQIAALQPKQLSAPAPFAWWTFDHGQATDRMGRFTDVQLCNGARVANGRLQLDGPQAYLIAHQRLDRIKLPHSENDYVSPIHFRPQHGDFGDPIPFFWKGQYHVFYLMGGQPRCTWEHIISTDLIHWRELPTALKPSGPPDGFDGGNMATGSVIEKDGTFHIFYCGQNLENPRGSESVLHATSTDLSHWTKHPQDRIDPDGIHYSNKPVRDFRDAYVFWKPDEQLYWMVVQADALTARGPGLLVSRDLTNWRQLDGLAGVRQDCPDLFQIGDTWYLLGADTYLWGKQPHGQFLPPPVDNHIDSPCVRAGKRMFDGKRHVWVGWIWDYNPRCDAGCPGWGGTQCLPREIYSGSGGQLYCRPVAEVPAQFTKTVVDLSPTDTLPSSVEVPDNYMLDCTVQFDTAAEFTLAMRQTGAPESGYRLILRPRKQEAELVSAAFSHLRHIELDTTKSIHIQAFVQGSIIEVFINDRYSLSCRAYDYSSGRLGLAVSTGPAKLLGLQVKVPGATSSLQARN